MASQSTFLFEVEKARLSSMHFTVQLGRRNNKVVMYCALCYCCHNMSGGGAHLPIILQLNSLQYMQALTKTHNSKYQYGKISANSLGKLDSDKIKCGNDQVEKLSQKFLMKYFMSSVQYLMFELDLRLRNTNIFHIFNRGCVCISKIQLAYCLHICKILVCIMLHLS